VEQKLNGTVDIAKKIDSSMNDLKKMQTTVDQCKNDANNTNNKFNNLQNLIQSL